MSLEFTDTEMPKVARTGRTREENPFDALIAAMVKDGWVGTSKAKQFTVEGVASLADNETLRKYRRQLTAAGDPEKNALLKDAPAPYNTEGVTVPWNAEQTTRKTKTNPGLVTVKFSVRAKIRQQRDEKSDATE